MAENVATPVVNDSQFWEGLAEARKDAADGFWSFLLTLRKGPAAMTDILDRAEKKGDIDLSNELIAHELALQWRPVFKEGFKQFSRAVIMVGSAILSAAIQAKWGITIPA